MSFASPFPLVSIPDVSVFDYVFGATGELEGAERIAFIDASTGERVDFQQLRDRVLAAAGALAALGVAPGAVVALHAPNSPEFGVAFHAILRAGAFELMNRPDAPTEVVIDEYVEVAKSFFEGPEPGFVNAALDGIAQDERK